MPNVNQRMGTRALQVAPQVPGLTATVKPLKPLMVELSKAGEQKFGRGNSPWPFTVNTLHLSEKKRQVNTNKTAENRDMNSYWKVCS